MATPLFDGLGGGTHWFSYVGRESGSWAGGWRLVLYKASWLAGWPLSASGDMVLAAEPLRYSGRRRVIAMGR